MTSPQPPYWHRQMSDKPLYPNIEWSRPEQKSLAGKLGIVGGNKLGFAGVAEAYSTARDQGVGEIRVLLPDALKKSIPPTITDTIFAPTNISGSISSDAAFELKALGSWAGGMLLAGDAGRSSETAICYERFVREYTGPLTITRDSVDLLINNGQLLVERPSTVLVISFAQLQRIFRSVYYPKILSFSMQLAQLVDAIHKFTITYPVVIAVLHQDHIVVASGGTVTTTPWDSPMLIWRGVTASKAASYWLWHPSQPLEAVTTSLVATLR